MKFYRQIFECFYYAFIDCDKVKEDDNCVLVKRCLVGMNQEAYQNPADFEIMDEDGWFDKESMQQIIPVVE